jgi:hypothetical protein
MLVNEQILAAAALISLFSPVRGQGASSLVAPKGAKVLTVGVIGGTIDIHSRIIPTVNPLTSLCRLWLDWVDPVPRSFLSRGPSSAHSGGRYNSK